MFKCTKVTYRSPLEEETNLFDQTLARIEENNQKNEKLSEIIELYNILVQTGDQLENQIKYKKNKEFLYNNSNNIKRRFYHYRDEHKHPRITVCILLDKMGVYSRGISICSFLDQPVKSDGRDRAEDRAIIALKTHNNSGSISRIEAEDVASMIPNFLEEMDQIKKIYSREIFKSWYNVIPTKFELRLFNPPEGKE